jgi:hypothetical protein
MAMLMTNEVFARTWGSRGGPAPEEDYWPFLIGRVKAIHPDLVFMAEAYWDMEWTLQQQGFDLCYDKRLYDRLLHETAESVRGHLTAGAAYQERLIRFIENHDEPRAAAAFGPAKARAAALAMSTLQGARLYHDGQFEGRRAHIPVFLGRGPDEPIDADLREFYTRLVRAVSDAGAGRPRNRGTSSWSTFRTTPRRRACGCRGRTSRRVAGSSPTGSTGARSSAPAPNWPPRVCTWRSNRGRHISSPRVQPQ